MNTAPVPDRIRAGEIDHLENAARQRVHRLQGLGDNQRTVMQGDDLAGFYLPDGPAAQGLEGARL